MNNTVRAKSKHETPPVRSIGIFMGRAENLKDGKVPEKKNYSRLTAKRKTLKPFANTLKNEKNFHFFVNMTGKIIKEDILSNTNEITKNCYKKNKVIINGYKKRFKTKAYSIIDSPQLEIDINSLVIKGVSQDKKDYRPYSRVLNSLSGLSGIDTNKKHHRGSAKLNHMNGSIERVKTNIRKIKEPKVFFSKTLKTYGVHIENKRPLDPRNEKKSYKFPRVSINMKV